MNTQTISIRVPVVSPTIRWLALGLAMGMVLATVLNPALGPRHVLGVNPGAGAGEHTVSVTGTGRVLLSPDTAALRLGVTATAKTVKEARAAAAQSMTAVLASLKLLGIADRDIQTTILSLQPVYDWQNGTNPPRLTGYTLSNGIVITIRNLDKVGEAIDGALAAGATSLDSISFRVADQAAAERQARESAMAEAKAKAGVLAAAAGVSIIGVQSISETMAPVPYPIFYGEAAGAALRDIATPVMPGTNEVSVTVAVVYLIG